MKRKIEEKKNSKDDEKTEYEQCKICKINHNQGRRHNFFPRHTNSLSSLFSRFLHKLSLLKPFLTNPTFNLPGHASSIPRFWCIFCEIDVDNAGSSFACGNAIEHLASEEHLKNLKHFLWKYGGGGNKVDSFRITDTELAEWEKRCNALKSEAGSSSKRISGFLRVQSNDIQPFNGLMNSFDQNSVHFLESNMSNNVMPLQYDTNENYQVCTSDIAEAGKIGPSQCGLASAIPQRSEHGLSTWTSTSPGLNAQFPLPSVISESLADGPLHAGVHRNQSLTNEKTSIVGYQTITRISFRTLEDYKGNVHSGAPPPWLEGSESIVETGLPSSSAQKHSKKISKLNPKRVGAAWAEKRKRELEMERRGEIVVKPADPEWLPNFGRVWQSGSRKESIKEFNKEKLNVPKAGNQIEPEIQVQPYISKRMRQGTSDISCEDVDTGRMLKS